MTSQDSKLTDRFADLRIRLEAEAEQQDHHGSIRAAALLREAAIACQFLASLQAERDEAQQRFACANNAISALNRRAEAAETARDEAQRAGAAMRTALEQLERRFRKEGNSLSADAVDRTTPLAKMAAHALASESLAIADWIAGKLAATDGVPTP